MAEMAEIRDAARPHEILLVADALTGQDAVNLAKNFNERVGVTGIILTRMDGDGRGGAALSMRAVTASRSSCSASAKRWTRLRTSIRDASLIASSHGRHRQPRREGGRKHRHGASGQDGREDA